MVCYNINQVAQKTIQFNMYCLKFIHVKKNVCSANLILKLYNGRFILRNTVVLLVMLLKLLLQVGDHTLVEFEDPQRNLI